MARAAPVSPPEHVFDSLRSPLQFRRVLRRGRRRRVEGVTVVALPRAQGGAAVGLATGRGFAGAVERNRAKRRLRHALLEVGLAPATDYVVIATPPVCDVGFERLVGWLRAALEEKA